MKYQELMKLNEDNLMFITNPGRMGDEENDSLKYDAIYNVWKDAFMNMVNDKNYVLKK